VIAPIPSGRILCFLVPILALYRGDKLILPSIEPSASCCLASSVVTILATFSGLLPVMSDGTKCVSSKLNYGRQNLFSDDRPGSKSSDMESKTGGSVPRMRNETKVAHKLSMA